MMKHQPPVQYTVTGHPVNLRGPSYVPRSIQALQALSEWRDQDRTWLREDICKAFKYLVGLKLGNTPAVEMLPITAEMWLEIVGEGMTEEQDRDRIRAGFKQLLRSVKWWPQPADLLKVLPRRVQCRDASQCVSTAPQTDEAHAAASAKFQEILDSFR